MTIEVATKKRIEREREREKRKEKEGSGRERSIKRRDDLTNRRKRRKCWFDKITVYTR